MAEIQGRRVYPDSVGYLAIKMGPGDYGFFDGKWYVKTPVGGFAMITGRGKDKDWKVEEHEDGTISVTPSIKQEGRWHGYLTKGIWKEV